MDLYETPNFKFRWPKMKLKWPQFLKSRNLWFLILVIFLSSLFGFLAGSVSSSFLYSVKERLLNPSSQQYQPQTSQEQETIKVVKDSSPAVVSIIITKDVPVMEQYFYNPFGENSPLQIQIPGERQVGTEKQEIGGGTGFLVSEDGMILTNKHVVADEAADYTVFMNDGKSFQAKVLARDPIQDLAVIKIEQEKTVDDNGTTLEPFPTVKLGDSDKLQPGQTVIAIGNALGEFRNTVSVGVVSGLGRTITASGGGVSETIEDVIQTDAAINPGNSGGPLLNLQGEVIGINTATVDTAQSIGFAIPINKAKRDIEQVRTQNKIVYPFLGVRYVTINDKIKSDNNLPVNYGAWIKKGEGGEAAVISGSAADKAGLKEGDIILELNGEKITSDTSFSELIQKYNAGDTIILKILRNGQEQILQATLDGKS